LAPPPEKKKQARGISIRSIGPHPRHPRSKPEPFRTAHLQPVVVGLRVLACTPLSRDGSEQIVISVNGGEMSRRAFALYRQANPVFLADREKSSCLYRVLVNEELDLLGDASTDATTCGFVCRMAAKLKRAGKLG
jgi:hypothetical protein